MSLRTDDVVRLSGPPPGETYVKVSRRVQGSTRRDFLRRVFAMATIVSFHLLDVFPTARPALAWGHREIWDGRQHGYSTACGGLGSWVGDDDCDGCNHPRKHCCCDAYGWFKETPTANYELRRNACKDNKYDGWIWTYSPCCCLVGRKNQEWRCHDGWYCGSGDCDDRYCADDSCGSLWWLKSICKSLRTSESCLTCN